MQLSRLATTLAPSATIEMTARARQLAREGREIISLSAGEPDFATPAHIREAAHRAIEQGLTRYTDPAGMPELREAVARKFARDNGLRVTPEEVTVTAGAKQALANAILALMDPGEEAIIPAPHWVSYPAMVRMAGGRPVTLPTRPEDGFRPRPEALEAAIGPRTRLLLLNSPGNPSGTVLTAADLEALADVLRAHPQVCVIADDIYEHIRHDGRSFATLAAVAPDLAERVVTVNGVSKAYAMTGWRIGYAAGPRPLVTAMTRLAAQSTSCPASVSQAAALAALEGPQDFLAGWRERFARRRDLVLRRLAEIEGISCPVPEGAFYAYPSVAGLIGRRTPGGRTITDDGALAEALLEEVGVAVVPGIAFGLSPHVRISFATGEAALERALDRLADFARRLR